MDVWWDIVQSIPILFSQATPAPIQSGSGSGFGWNTVSTLAAILAGAGAIYAANEARKLRIEQTLPEVSIFLESHPDADNVAQLVIQNIGQRPAHHIRFLMSGNSALKQKVDARDIYIIKNELPYLAPGRSLRFMIATWSEIGEDSLEITVSYTKHRNDDAQERSAVETYILDPKQVGGMLNLTNFNRQAAGAVHDAMIALKLGRITVSVKDGDKYDLDFGEHIRRVSMTDDNDDGMIDFVVGNRIKAQPRLAPGRGRRGRRSGPASSR